MKPKLLLRIAAILMLLHAIGHTVGALTSGNAPNKAIGDVITAMQTNHFDFMGRSVTLAAFYNGYGISMIWVLAFVSLLLWLLSNETANILTARLLIPLTTFLILLAVTEYIYFFPFAAAFTFIAGLFALFARLRLNNFSKIS